MRGVLELAVEALGHARPSVGSRTRGATGPHGVRVLRRSPVFAATASQAIRGGWRRALQED